MATRNTRTFSDLDLGFQAHPISKDVSKKFDENAIKQSIKNLILTNNYERPFQSSIGSQIKSMLFEPFTPVLSAMIKRSIENTITSFEPRVNLLEVLVLISPDNNGLYVTIKFAIVNTTTPVSVDLFLERTR